MSAKRSFPRSQNILLAGQLAGDLLFGYLGMCAGYFLRFHTLLRRVGVENIDARFITYFPLLALGTIFLVGSYAYLNLYDARLLLRPQRSANIILRGTFFWFALFLGTSLALKFEPSISRLFVATACLCALGLIIGWRLFFFYALSGSAWRQRITQRVALVGWSPEVQRLTEAIQSDRNHPYFLYGVIVTAGTESETDRSLLRLGSLAELEDILEEHLIDIVVVADLDLSRDRLLSIATACERRYVDFKVIPSFFQVFVSNLRMQTISGVPLLGVEKIPLTSLPNQLLKRCVDTRRYQPP